MFRTKPGLTAIETRKQLLIAESEINRVKLLEEGQAFAGEVSRLVTQATSINTIAKSILPLVSGLAELTGAKAMVKSSWVQKAFSGARLACTVWALFRSRNSNS